MKALAEHSEIIILAVGTPTHPITQEADMQYIRNAATELAPHLDRYRVIAIKSTVPVGEGDRIENLLRQINPQAEFDLVSLPEFLREGFAVQDFFHPDRVIIGTNSARARKLLQSLYERFFDRSKILYVGRRSAEMIKYASNAFLAMKIHYINEMANLCEAVDADISEVAQGMGSDSRVGPRFLNPGPGYGGSCFPKDTQALASIGRKNDVELSLVESVIKGNARRKIQMARRILEMIGPEIKCPQIAILGLAFKGETDDCRQSPALEIIQELLAENVNLVVFDPKAMPNAKKFLGNSVIFAQNECDALKNAEIAVILTEWESFKNFDYKTAKTLMKTPKILDLRNILNPLDARKNAFIYRGIGRK